MQPRRLSTNVSYESRGAMQHRVDLMKQNARRADDGEFLSPTLFAESWASIRMLAGRELDKAQQVIAEVTHMIVIPYQPGLEAQMLVNFEGRQFVIQAIEDPDER